MKYDIQQEPIVLSKPVIDSFLKEDNPADLIALYVFYYYTAKWQKTNQPRATDKYCMQGLHWGYARYHKAHKKLIALNLIQRVKRHDPTTGKITGWYVKVNFIWKQETIEALSNKESIQNTQNPELVKSSTGKQSTNALSSVKENALKTNREVLEIEPPTDFFILIQDKYNTLFENNEVITETHKAFLAECYKLRIDIDSIIEIAHKTHKEEHEQYDSAEQKNTPNFTKVCIYIFKNNRFINNLPTDKNIKFFKIVARRSFLAAYNKHFKINYVKPDLHLTDQIFDKLLKQKPDMDAEFIMEFFNDCTENACKRDYHRGKWSVTHIEDYYDEISQLGMNGGSVLRSKLRMREVLPELNKTIDNLTASAAARH